MTYGSVPHPMPGLKLFMAGGYVVGFAGDLRYAPLLARWFNDDCPVGCDDFDGLWDDDWDIIVMDEDGKIGIALADKIIPLDQEYYAIGSGAATALGAMAAGASAAEAIKIAAQFDVFTNANVEQITVADLRKTETRKVIA
ncbi:proteasome subunit beta [Citromicrobium phage vB_CbaS-RXM]|nr:proteasome subunit beta [Citromicrobium phage vB_CbaS-RXM]